MPDRPPGRERQPEEADTPQGRLAAFLRSQLLKRDISTKDFVGRLQERIDVTHSTVDRWLSGKTPIAWANLEPIAQSLGYPSHQRMLTDYANFRVRKSR